MNFSAQGEMRVGENRGKANCRVLCMALLLCGASIVATPASASASEQVLRTPVKKWQRELSEDQTHVTLVNTGRVAAVDLRIDDALPNDGDVQRLVNRLSGQSSYKVRGKWPADVLKQVDVQMGVSITLPDGRKGMFAAIWRKRPDGRYGVASYMAIANAYSDENITDFKLVRSLGNQLARGAILAPSLIPVTPQPPVIIASTQPLAVPAAPPVVAQAPIIAVVPDIAAVPIVAPAVRVVAAPVIAPAPVVPAAVAVSVPTLTPPTATVAAAPQVTAPPPIVAPALSISTRNYPFAGAAGTGVPLTQIATLLYAPLESSEVFVLFKDGSFHEDLPVALEEWNAGASRRADPASWGQWKNSEEPGEFELSYAADDVVTISATKIKPAKSGMVLVGSYAVEGQNGAAIGEQIEFTGNKFVLRRQGQETSGIYRVENYSVILNYEDGRIEHRPFFVVPPEEDDDDPSIWLGDQLRVRIE